VSDTFMRLSDDQCLLKEWDGCGIWHMGDQFDFEQEIRRNKWWKRFANTCQHLQHHGRPVFFYDCHCPIAVIKKEFIRIAEEADYVSPPGMCINSLYCNSIDIPREQMNGQKVAVEREIELKNLTTLTADKLFLGYGQIGTNDQLKQFLQERFPKKSRFER